MNDIKTFLDYYRIGSSTIGRWTFTASGRGEANNLLEDDALTVWLSRLIARYVEAPLIRLWDTLWERVGL